MIHESYVTLKTGKLLQEAKFGTKNCRFYYSEFTDAPTSAGVVDEDTGKVYGLFDSLCCGESDDVYDIPVPTLAIAQKWLREVKGYELWVYPFSTHYRFSFYGYLANEDNYTDFDTYEQALEAGIQKALKYILKDKEDGRNTNN